MIKDYNMGGGTSNCKTNELEPNDPKKRHYPTGLHPGCCYTYLKRRKHIVIPTISMGENDLCDFERLDIGNDKPSQTIVSDRERFAKTALMLFSLHRKLADLRSNNGRGSFWDKFVELGGLSPYKPEEGKRLEPRELRAIGGFWERGKDILHNIQARKTIQSKMSRTKDALQILTEKPTATGERGKSNIDADEEELKYDMEIGEFDVGLEDTDVMPYSKVQLRSSDVIIDKATVSKHNITEFVFDSHDLLAENTDVQASAKEDDEVKKPEPELPKPKKYETIIKFIAGSVVGTDDRTSANGELPSLEKFGAELDKKQFVAFKVLCSSFLLYVLDKGTDGDTKLGKLLNASINCTCPDERNALRKKLLEIGANIELVMFITGPAGCGKSTCVSLAQEYCHKFCQAMGLPFDDNTFYFTSTTGSSAALFGGMTIHSAAHLNKRNITEEMCKEWESVIILIIDELSFFKVSDMNNLDRKLRRLKKCDKKYGGVIIVFSGDFHQLPPVKASDSEILYCCSDDATMWELSINCPIFLEISHRFKNDKLWGEIMNRFRNGEDTEDDRHEINKLYIGPDNEVTMNSNTAIACTTNKERNAVEFLAWK